MDQMHSVCCNVIGPPQSSLGDVCPANRLGAQVQLEFLLGGVEEAKQFSPFLPSLTRNSTYFQGPTILHHGDVPRGIVVFGKFSIFSHCFVQFLYPTWLIKSSLVHPAGRFVGSKIKHTLYQQLFSIGVTVNWMHASCCSQVTTAARSREWTLESYPRNPSERPRSPWSCC
jgi:hypothetical protein